MELLFDMDIIDDWEPVKKPGRPVKKSFGIPGQSERPIVRMIGPQGPAEKTRLRKVEHFLEFVDTLREYNEEDEDWDYEALDDY